MASEDSADVANKSVQELPTSVKNEDVEDLKQKANAAFKKAQLLRKTTAGKQYLNEAKSYYIQAIQVLSGHSATEETLALVCTLHCNLAATFLLEIPPAFKEAKAAAEIALSINPKQVKALYRRAQATLEDNREGLPEDALIAAHSDLRSALEIEPNNTQILAEAERVRRRLAAIEEARRIPSRREIIEKIPQSLLERGSDLVDTHGYAWGQNETVVHVFVPAQGLKVSKSKDVTCEVKPTFLRLVLPSKQAAMADSEKGMGSAANEFELFGPLHKPVRPDDCSWQLENDGLLLHVELAKRDTGEDKEHWLSVWSAHPQTRAPSANEKARLKEMARAACVAESQERKEEKKMPDGAEERLKKLREAFPDMPIEWGDTSLDSFKD